MPALYHAARLALSPRSSAIMFRRTWRPRDNSLSNSSTAKAAQRYEGKFYIQGAQPSGVLTVDTKLEPDAKDKVRQEWQRVHTGVDNAFRVAVLDLGLKYTPIAARCPGRCIGTTASRFGPIWG